MVLCVLTAVDRLSVSEVLTLTALRHRCKNDL